MFSFRKGPRALSSFHTVNANTDQRDVWKPIRMTHTINSGLSLNSRYLGSGGSFPNIITATPIDPPIRATMIVHQLFRSFVVTIILTHRIARSDCPPDKTLPADATHRC